MSDTGSDVCVFPELELCEELELCDESEELELELELELTPVADVSP